MRLRRAGLLNPGRPFTALAHGVSGITHVICEGASLERRSFWPVNDGGVEGKPTQYAISAGKIYVWPIPDRTYRVDLHWNGRPDIDDRMFDCTVEWMESYTAALKEAKEARA